MNILTSFLIAEPRFANLKYVLGTLPLPAGKDTSRRIHNKSKSYSKYYKVLELEDGADQDLVRRAFINLCKKYHPDSGTSTADSVKFQEIENAYRMLQNKFAEERWNVNEGLGEYGLYYDESKRKSKGTEEVKVFDIKHNAPQHRQYLSFDGVGSGTPSQRQKQYAAHKRESAIQNIFSHRIKKLSEKSLGNEEALILKDKKEAKKIKTRYGMDRLVEDLIQESMARGEFDNLKGSGKPLPQSNHNPYVDFVTHKMNQVMIDNGFIPEWITLQREISDDIDLIKKALVNERRTMGPHPLSQVEQRDWEAFLSRLSENVKNLNKKIDQFNLVVPILDKQMLHFNLVREGEKVVEKGEYSEVRRGRRESTPEARTASSRSSFDFISVFMGNR